MCSPSDWSLVGLCSVLLACGDGGAPPSASGETGEPPATTLVPTDDTTGAGATDDTTTDGVRGSEGSTAEGDGTSGTGEPQPDLWDCGPPLGARLGPDGSVEVRVVAPAATRIEVALFAAPLGQGEVLRLPMDLGADGFTLRIEPGTLQDAALDGPRYYGLRVWGPNWPYDARWQPGSEIGRIADVDAAGNRMNPNKLVLDPYALEVSQDPVGPDQLDGAVFVTDADNRARDSAPMAPKGVIVPCETVAPGPERPFRDEVVYEVHVRGLTGNDASVPEEERGTYAGAARKAEALAALGVTAVEFLPLHETPNDHNELSADATGDNYWGYSSLSFFAPDRRYAADRSPGGPTTEFRDMVAAFHAAGIKVYLDVVYNHTAEGGANGAEARIFSFRGLDNAGFYELAADPAQYVSSNGVGPNVDTTQPWVAQLVLDSLHYGHEQLGLDGFRFDLASVVANGCRTECYAYDATVPERIAEELAREPDGGQGVDLIAEAWGATAGTYQVGNFPVGWAEWNDRYRDALRRDLNRLGSEVVTLRELTRRIAGSPDLYEDDGRSPAASVNFVVAHDGFTLHDLFRYDVKNNDQPWPHGPSDGGSDNNLASSHASDPQLQARATRTAFALLCVSAGVPMMTGGDESGRTMQGNNNPYNLDNEANWLHQPGDATFDTSVRQFTARMLAFRAEHVALRPTRSWAVFDDEDGDGITQVRWFRDDGVFVDDAYLDAEANHFIAWQLDGDELGDDAATLFFAYNGWSGAVTATLPEPPAGLSWHRAVDTGPQGAGFGFVESDGPAVQGSYSVEARTLVALIAR